MKPNVTLERFALAQLQLRGPHPPGAPALAVEAIDAAVGALKRIARLTGETPAALCRRLGITGARRRMCVPPQSGGRWRFTAEERRQAYHARDIRRLSARAAEQARAEALGIELDSPQWLDLMARDRAFDARMKTMRREAGPPHPMRERHHNAKK